MNPSDEIRQALEQKKFRTIEEGQAFLDSLTQTLNTRHREEFHGLSSDQMGQLLYAPFDSPQFVEFPTFVNTPLSSVPVVKLFENLVSAIGEKGLKPTATGNLTLRVVREIMLAVMDQEQIEEFTRFGRIRSEVEYRDLNVTRLVAQIAGLIRKYKGRFIVGRDCRKSLGSHGMSEVYPKLLRAYMEEFNWEYQLPLPEIEFIQSSCPFTLYLLEKYGDEFRPAAFYEDAFLGAFPVVIERLRSHIPTYFEERLRSSYSHICLRKFAHFVGFAEINEERGDYTRSFQIKKTPVLSASVLFHLPELNVGGV